MARVDVIRVKGGARLAGDVRVGGAKNSALKLMAVALLAEGRTVVANVPRITDIAIMAEVLRRLGCEVTLDGGEATIDVPAEPGSEADYDLVRRLRASICVLGPLLARRGYVRVAQPGGDAIGSRGPGHARLRPGPDGRGDLRRARLRHRLGAGRAARREDLAGLPERRRDREPADGGGAGPGRHGDRQRGPGAGDRRHLRDAHRDGRPDHRRRHLHAGDRGRRGAQAGAAHHGRGPDRRRHLGVRAPR